MSNIKNHAITGSTRSLGGLGEGIGLEHLTRMTSISGIYEDYLLSSDVDDWSAADINTPTAPAESIVVDVPNGIYRIDLGTKAASGSCVTRRATGGSREYIQPRDNTDIVFICRFRRTDDGAGDGGGSLWLGVIKGSTAPLDTDGTLIAGQDQKMGFYIMENQTRIFLDCARNAGAVSETIDTGIDIVADEYITVGFRAGVKDISDNDNNGSVVAYISTESTGTADYVPASREFYLNGAISGFRQVGEAAENCIANSDMQPVYCGVNPAADTGTHLEIDYMYCGQTR